MNEPSLEGIEDYNTLDGEKKRVVWAVIFAGLLLGAIYSIAMSFNTQDELISQDIEFKKVPMK